MEETTAVKHSQRCSDVKTSEPELLGDGDQAPGGVKVQGCTAEITSTQQLGASCPTDQPEQKEGKEGDLEKR